MNLNKEKKQNILRFIGRGNPALVLIFLVAICIVLVNVVGCTYAYFSTKLGSYTNSARVAVWDVKVELDSESAVALKTGAWSSPYKIVITNQSEVLASYGYDATSNSGADSFFSFLTFAFDSDNTSGGGENTTEINGVRIFDPDSGEIADLSNMIQNNTVAIRFIGTLYPERSKTYYIQFKTDSPNGSFSEQVSADADFYFKQTFTEVAAGFSAVN